MDLGNQLQSISQNTQVFSGVTLIVNVATYTHHCSSTTSTSTGIGTGTITATIIGIFIISPSSHEHGFNCSVFFFSFKAEISALCILCTLSEIHLFPVYETLRIAKFDTESFNLLEQRSKTSKEDF